MDLSTHWEKLTLQWGWNSDNEVHIKGKVQSPTPSDSHLRNNIVQLVSNGKPMKLDIMA